MASSKKLPNSPADSSAVISEVQTAIAACLVKPGSDSLLVGFSGGLDSVVLLHAVVAVCGSDTVTAVHVNHGLQPDTDQWAEQCAVTAEALGVNFHREDAAPRPARFVNGLENWARDERRAAFVRAAHQLDAQDVLLAHHRDDQSETVLWHLARGAGPDGLAGMRAQTKRDGLRLMRPLLSVSRETLRAYADRFELPVIDDPSNMQLEHTRNRIRHRVMPQLNESFPGFDQALARAAANAADVTDALRLALFNGEPPDKLSRAKLQGCPPVLARQMLRIWLQSKQVAMPDRVSLLDWLPRLLDGENAYVQINHGDDQLCRYRDEISLRRNVVSRSTESGGDVRALASVQVQWDGQASMALPGFDGALQFAHAAPGELAVPADRLLQEPLTISPLQMSARIRPQPSGPSRRVQQLCQEHAIARWDRPSLPMLWFGQTPLFVARIGTNADCIGPTTATNRGVHLHWQVPE